MQLFLLFNAAVLLPAAVASTLEISSEAQANAAATYAIKYESNVSPVAKVIELLGKMVAKGKEEAHKEKVQFATYSQWCEMIQVQKKKDIDEAMDKIDDIKADLSSAETAVNAFAEEITSHQEDIETFEEQVSSAEKVRRDEDVDFHSALKEYQDSILAVKNAIKALSKEAYNRETADAFVQNEEHALFRADAKMANSEYAPPSLLQLSSDSSPKEVMNVVNSMLQEHGLAPGQARAYDFQSNRLIKLMEEFEQKFYKEKVELEKKETKKKNTYAKLMLSLQNSIADEKQGRDQKTTLKSKKDGEIATLGDDLATFQDSEAKDKKYLADVKVTCEQKATDFEARQKLREEELEAINKALDVIKHSSVKKTAENVVFLQVQQSATAFAQLRQRGWGGAKLQTVKARMVEFLQAKAYELHSAALGNVAVAVGAKDIDAFTLIKDLINGLIARLQQENLKRLKKKQFCESELATNANTRSAATQKVDELTADLDKLKVSVKQLAENKKTTQEEVDKLTKDLNEAVDIRTKEHAKNVETVADAKAAQEAVATATTVLKDFYDKASQATALVQEKSSADADDDAAPEIFDGSYKGMSGESSGALGMLEIIAADFAKIEADTAQAEDTADFEHKQFVKHTKVAIASKTSDVAHFGDKRQEQLSDITAKSEDFTTAQTALNATLAAWDSLKEKCSADKTYEEEEASRRETIASLVKALEMIPKEM